MIFMKISQTLLHILLALISAEKNAEIQTQNVVQYCKHDFKERILALWNPHNT